MLPEMGQQQQDEISSAVKGTAHSSSRYLRTCCIMLERAMNDNVIPVFVASLLLLDDCISEFEQSDMASKEVLSHLSVIAPCLVSHLGDNKSKVVEGAETALLSMALSKPIGPAYIAHLLTKRTSEMRTVRAIIARMRVAQVSIGVSDLFGLRNQFSYPHNASHPHPHSLPTLSCRLCFTNLGQIRASRSRH